MMSNEIINKDCLTGLKELPDCSIDCCVTSPPYYGLRNYGHDDQIGLEATPELYVENMVAVFNEVRRVLKKEGTLWLNLGDSYSGSTGKSGGEGLNTYTKEPGATGSVMKKSNLDGYKPKDLIGIPWMVAFALRSSGWYLRQDIIWHKPNPMPESVTDRCTKSHEYVFLLSKSAKYYYDADAIKTESLQPDQERTSKSDRKRFPTEKVNGIRNRKDSYYVLANKRSVWSVVTQSFPEAHFATFPEDLIVDMIKAGCPVDGVVLDPFMGAGTTALVARKLGRNYIGFELNPDYIKIANKRLKMALGMFL